MIKINIISTNKLYSKLIKNPDSYFKTRLYNLNKKFKKYEKKILFVTLLLSGDKDIKRLNKKFRSKNKVTDVLSFPFYNNKELKIKLKNEKEVYLGDIIVNLNQIKPKENKKLFRLELEKLLIHGLVHLFGHDHKKEKDYKKMVKIEKRLLSYLGR